MARALVTPVTPGGLHSLDDLDAIEAVMRAWTDPGPHPSWHEATKVQVRAAMPLLARALDRLVDVRGRR